MRQNRKVKLKEIWSEIKWAALGALWLGSIALGYFGFSAYAASQGLPLSFTDKLYRTLQLISMNSGGVAGEPGWMLDVARYLIPALTVFTAFQAVIDLFREQTQWVRLWGLHEHVIVCGMGRRGRCLVDSLIAAGERVVVIEKDIEPATAAEYRRQGLILLEGDATEIETLHSARVHKAKALICLLREDRQNLSVAHRAYGLVRDEREQDLRCIVHLTHQNLMKLVRRSELMLQAEDHFVLEIFNTYDDMARMILNEDPGWAEAGDGGAPTMLILGLGQLGSNILHQAAYRWYAAGQKHKLRFLIADWQADQRIKALQQDFPELVEVCELVPLQVDLSSNHQLRDGLLPMIRWQDIDRAYICLGDPVLAIQVYFNLQQINGLSKVPTAVRLSADSGLADVIESPVAGVVKENGSLRLFDLTEATCSASQILGGAHRRLAKKLRENYILSQNSADATEQLGLHWAQVPAAERESNEQQARRLHKLLTAHGYALNPLYDWSARTFSFPETQVDSMAKMEHTLWCEWKQEQGWQHGDRRDDQNRIHPDLCPWEDLPSEEKEKSIQFIRSIPSVLADLGFQVDDLA
ncbi:NAD-binding protein [bacterium]|nr:NAD-binding protein [bacterium]